MNRNRSVARALLKIIMLRLRRLHFPQLLSAASSIRISIPIRTFTLETNNFRPTIWHQRKPEKKFLYLNNFQHYFMAWVLYPLLFMFLATMSRVSESERRVADHSFCRCWLPISFIWPVEKKKRKEKITIFRHPFGMFTKPTNTIALYS